MKGKKGASLLCIQKSGGGFFWWLYVDSMWEGTSTSGYVYIRLSTEVAVIIFGSSQIVTQQ